MSGAPVPIAPAVASLSQPSPSRIRVSGTPPASTSSISWPVVSSCTPGPPSLRCPRTYPWATMDDVTEHPRLVQTVLDTTDVRALAEFYRELLGLRYRPGDEPP